MRLSKGTLWGLVCIIVLLMALPMMAKQVTLTVWYGTDNPIAASRVKAFMELYPDIKVEALGGGVDEQRLMTAIVSGNPPDVIHIDRYPVPGWAVRDSLRPIDDLIVRDGLDLSVFAEAPMNELTYNNQIWGLPHFVHTNVVYINNAILQEAGIDPNTVDTSDWNGLVALGEKLTTFDGEAMTRLGFDSKIQDGHLWYWAWGLDGEFLSADGRTASFSDPRIVEALQFGVDSIVAQGGNQARAEFSSTWQWDAQHPFFIGNVAITLYEDWLLGMLSRFAADMDFTIKPLMKRGTNEPITMSSGNAFVIPKGAKNVDAAWEFVKFMTGTEGWVIGNNAVKAQAVANGTPYIPSTTANNEANKVIFSEIYEPINPALDEAMRVLSGLVAYAKYRPQTPIGAELNDALNEAMRNSYAGTVTPKEALELARVRVQRSLDDYYK